MRIRKFLVDSSEGLRICSNTDELLDEVRSMLDMDELVGPVAVETSSGDVYVVDVSLVPLDDAREELKDYVEQLIEDIEEYASSEEDDW